MSKKIDKTEIVKNFLEKLEKNANSDKPLYKTNEEGDLIFNQYDEETVLNTDAIKFITHEKQYKDWDSISLFVLNDTHIACTESRVKKIERFISQVYNTPNGVLALNGDLINFAIKDSVSDPYTQKLSILESISKIEKMLEKMNAEDRIIVNVLGNHDGHRSAKLVAITPVEKYVKNKKITAPSIALVKIKLKGSANLLIAFAHGEMAKGGALGTVQAGIKLAKSIFNGAPHFVFLGHTHQNASGSALVFMPDFATKSGRPTTKKQRITAFAVPPGITTEVYATRKGYPLANTDASLYEFIQLKDKDSFIWECNILDLSAIYTQQNMLSKSERIQLKKDIKFLNVEEKKFTEQFGEASLLEQIKMYKEYSAKNDKLLEDVVEKYNLTDTQLEKYFGL